MKKSIYVGVCLFLSLSLSAQTTTVSFKPGPTIGEDAYLFKLDGDCMPTSGWALTPALLNFGNEPELPINRWTWSYNGCNTGTQRSVLRFRELDNIPPNTNIQGAFLILRTPPSGYNWGGNSYYPGSPYINTNPGWVKLIKPDSLYAWNEQTITWDNFIPLNPASSFPPVEIPSTGSEYNWSCTLNVTNMLRQMFADRNNTTYWNNGFLLELQTEVHYRAQQIASSDNGHPDSWPELIVQYSSCMGDQHITTIDTITDCKGFTFNGQTFTTAGLHEIILVDSTGCDSIVRINLSMLLPHPIITVDKDTLSTTESYTSYQWLKDSAIIGSAIHRKYLVTENGDYQVIVTDEAGCLDTSEVYEVTNQETGVRDLELTRQIKVYPNISSDIVIIESPISVNAILVGFDGKIFLTQNAVEQLSLKNIAIGMYLLYLKDDDGKLIKVSKIIKQ